MIISPFNRRILKITAYILGSIIVLLTAFHFWFINHAEDLLEDLVRSRSNGKLGLSVKKFRFNWFSNDMQLRNAVFFSTDTATASTAYRFSVERIHVSVHEILPLVFEKKIVFDSISLTRPDIYVTRLRSTKNTDTTSAGASLPQEMGRVYKSIQDALQVLKVNTFHIDDGKFTLVNAMAPAETPVTITNIQFHLDNLQVDTSNKTGSHKILFSDNVALQTHHQDIRFPDGRHRLAFSNFRINIRNRMVEFDSCTITATKGDSANNSFRIFFDKLQMTNIDFDTLYQKEIIKADSVYCINPQFRLDVELEKRTGGPKPPPKLDELIQQLTGDLEVAFVIVQNGSFDINTRREGRPSSFTSDHNNFELQGLRIRKDQPRPLTVKSFAMAIRNYENFLRDSTYALQFDSILLNTRGIYLSNFSLKQMKGNKVINSFSMPQFVLNGLSWDDLIFEQRLSADKATLYHPVIDYSFVAKPRKQNKEDLFETLEGIGDVIQLNNLDIANGRIKINFKDNTQLLLDNATMSLLSQRIVESERVSNLQRSVSRLRFTKGSLHSGNITATLEDVDFTGREGKFTAGKVLVSNKTKTLDVVAMKVSVDAMQIDNKSFITEINGISWQDAKISIAGPVKKNESAPGFVIRNIKGGNTQFEMVTATQQKVSAQLQSVSADEFSPVKGKPPALTNLNATGKDFVFNNNGMNLSIGNFRVRDQGPSLLTNTRYENNSAGDSSSIIIPSASFNADIASILAGSIRAKDVELNRPVVRMFSTASATNQPQPAWPVIDIDNISITNPDILIDQPAQPGFSRIEWQSREGKNNLLQMKGVKTTSQRNITATQLDLRLQDFSFIAGGKKFAAGDGSLVTRIDDFHLKPNDLGNWDWHGTIASLQANNFLLDSLGQKKGRLHIASGKISKLAVGTSTLLNPRQLVKENTSFRMDEMTGYYENQDINIVWQNAVYDRYSKTFSIDSFLFMPALSREEFSRQQKYQADYMVISTGPVSAGPFDLYTYLQDTVLNAGTVTLRNVSINDYRDKRFPRMEGEIKHLPVNMLNKIPVKLTVDLINVVNGFVEYTELNEKTNQAGRITVNNLQAKVLGVKNHDHAAGDSLEVFASFKLQDSIPIRLSVKESYYDSLAGFIMSASASPVDARILNPVLIPLASVELQSGIVDTLFLRAKGNNHLATGNISLLYHDLKVKLLNNKVGQKKTIKGLASFLANALVIKRVNKTGNDAIYFERLKERSPLHYLVKITLSGITSSIGMKKNKRLLRQYKKELQKRNLSDRKND